MSIQFIIANILIIIAPVKDNYVIILPGKSSGIAEYSDGIDA